MDKDAPVIVIGGGPAGLAALLELARRGLPGLLLEALPILGGIARTIQFDGYRFDLGGHRFFTRIAEIESLWEELLGPDLLVRPRLSRIYYRGKFFNYPLRPFEVVRRLGLGPSLRVAASYVKARVRPMRPEDSFEAFVSNRFGRILYEIFFKTYTEKVWGQPCSTISPEWARQRLKDLSLGKALWTALNPFRRRARTSTSLIEQFRYPRLGPGMMWEACAARCREAGQELQLQTRVTTLQREGARIVAVRAQTPVGERAWPCRAVISTMPLPTLIAALEPPAPSHIQEAAAGLRFRDFLTVALVIDRPDLFPDNWIYIHDPGYRVGRIQNFRNWSPALVPNEKETVVGLEYFCQQDDALWQMPDEELVSLASQELQGLGLLKEATIRFGVVERVEKAYPVYDRGFAERVATIRDYLATFENLQTCGRNGLHRYNNLDHSMLTGLYAARNIAGEAHDVWAVNTEETYLEERR